MEEVWKDIKDYEGRYQISNKGRVKSFSLFHGTTKRILKPGNDSVGYLTVVLYNKDNKDNRTRITQRPHRLVAETFIPNPLDKCCINHKDGVKTNNHISNLEWVTYKENSQHALKMGLLNPYTRSVLMFDLKGKALMFFDSVKDASTKMNIDGSNIANSCNKKHSQAGGYIWRHCHDDIDSLEKNVEEVKLYVKRKEIQIYLRNNFRDLTNEKVFKIGKIIKEES